ncbi:hypothetical protein RZS08_17640, partial [Arthrospira platensis SPKY1]|nr:hypothetical protein [Arthrospira platensis SPKY1]
SAIAQKLIETANKSGKFFNNPNTFVGEGQDPESLNAAMLNNKEVFDQHLDKSLEGFREQLGKDYNRGIEYSRPEEFAMLYRVYTEHGPEAVTKVVNMFQEQDEEARAKMMKRYAPILQDAYAFSEEIKVEAYKPEDLDITQN